MSVGGPSSSSLLGVGVGAGAGAVCASSRAAKIKLLIEGAAVGALGGVEGGVLATSKRDQNPPTGDPTAAPTIGIGVSGRFTARIDMRLKRPTPSCPPCPNVPERCVIVGCKPRVSKNAQLVRPPSPTRTMDDYDHEADRQLLRHYLDHPPYLGRSEYLHMQQVKLLCGENGERVFDKATKCWGTTGLFQLQQLLGSGVWHPVGIDPALYGRLAAGARAKHEAAAAAWAAQEAQRMQAAKEKEAREAREAKARQEKQQREAERLAAKRRRDEAAAREAANVKVDPEVAKLAVRLSISTHEAAQILARPDVVPSKRELDECHALGFSQQAIAHSKVMDELGPRMTLSPHGRVLRWCEILAYRTRCDDKHRGIYFDRDALKPVVDADLAAFVAELNALGGGATRTPIKQGEQERAECDFARFYGPIYAH